MTDFVAKTWIKSSLTKRPTKEFCHIFKDFADISKKSDEVMNKESQDGAEEIPIPTNFF